MMFKDADRTQFSVGFFNTVVGHTNENGASAKPKNKD